jgi:hypothetical protein
MTIQQIFALIVIFIGIILFLGLIGYQLQLSQLSGSRGSIVDLLILFMFKLLLK